MKVLHRMLACAGLATGLAGSALATDYWVMRDDQSANRREVRVRSQDEDKTTTIRVSQGDSEYTIKMRGGKVVSAAIDGEELPPDRIVMDDASIRLLDEHGNTAFESARVRGSGLAYATGGGQQFYELAAMNEKRPMIGVTLSDVGDALAGQLGIDPLKAVVISGVSEGMPAEKAGLRKFDIIVEIDGKKDASAGNLSSAIRAKKVGDPILLGLLREGKPIEVKVVVGEGSPANVFEIDPAGEDVELQWMGQAGDSKALVERIAREAREQAVRGQELGEKYRALAMELGDRARVQMRAGGEKAQALLEELQDAWDDVRESVADDGAAKISKLMERLSEELSHAGDHMLRVMPRVEFFEEDHNGGPRALVVPRAPSAPAAPSAPRAPRGEFQWVPQDAERARALEDRIESLEARIDALLKKMEEKRGG